MISTFVTFAMNALMAALTPDKVKGFIAAGVARVQEYVAKTETKVDDFLIPATNLVLAALDVPAPNGQIDISAELKKLFDILDEQKDIFIDAGLDWIEDKVQESPTQLDDMTILPLCSLVRKVLNVPDDDENDDPTGPGI